MRPEHKQTSVGLIPEDWAVASLENLVNFANGKPHEGDVNEDGRYYLITLDSIGIDGRLKVDHKRTDTSDNSLKKNDIVAVLSDLAHGRLLGLCDLIPEDDKYVLNQRMGRLRLKVSADPFFVRLQINRRQEHFRKRGQGTSQRHIYKRDFDSLEIPFPPEVEQHAIAEALSDVDALLDGLEGLIAKKRDLKQAAMQQLLTGETRLPGFHHEWEIRRVGEIGEISSGGTPSTTQAHFWNGDIPWCTPTDITELHGEKYLSETARTISLAGLQSSSAEVIPPRSLIMTSRATIGECAINLIPMTTNQGFKNIVPFSKFDVEFLYYMMTTQKNGLLALCGGSTFLEMGKKQLSAYSITLPGDRDEQTAIATVLSDMDAEISGLERRRDKTRLLKQGMMQELLTGKIRLISAEALPA